MSRRFRDATWKDAVVAILLFEALLMAVVVLVVLVVGLYDLYKLMPSLYRFGALALFNVALSLLIARILISWWGLGRDPYDDERQM